MVEDGLNENENGNGNGIRSWQELGDKTDIGFGEVFFGLILIVGVSEGLSYVGKTMNDENDECDGVVIMYLLP